MKKRYFTIFNKFPEFPKKQILIWNFSEDTIKLRSDTFTKYLKLLLNERELIKDEYIQKFLDVDSRFYKMKRSK